MNQYIFPSLFITQRKYPELVSVEMMKRSGKPSGKMENKQFLPVDSLLCPAPLPFKSFHRSL
uniref:Uncharacterized protein n=1 Tax=Periophthalmus magnuspinnatus TaxID=409849 RepID=A0A3B4A950_9GOBI